MKKSIKQFFILLVLAFSTFCIEIKTKQHYKMGNPSHKINKKAHKKGKKQQKKRRRRRRRGKKHSKSKKHKKGKKHLKHPKGHNRGRNNQIGYENKMLKPHFRNIVQR